MGAVQVKQVPDELHEALRERAAERGLTVSEYLLELIRRDLAKPRLAAWIDEVAALPSAAKAIEGAAAVRAVRDEAEKRAERQAAESTNRSKAKAKRGRSSR